ncbi:MAG: hypothetical protein GON13_03525 [Nanoarchaeota archaeon]|nr:hypothetical protein [Nanoarchaeota archaeon]
MMGRVLFFVLLLAVPVFADDYDVVSGFEKTATQDWLSVRYGFNSVELDTFEIKMLKIIEFAEVKNYDVSSLEKIYDNFVDLHAELAVYIGEVDSTDDGYENLWDEFSVLKDDFKSSSRLVIVDEIERSEARSGSNVAVSLMQNSFETRFEEAKSLMKELSLQHFDWEVAFLNNLTSSLESRGVSVSSISGKVSIFSNRRGEIAPVFEKSDFFTDWQVLRLSVQENFDEIVSEVHESGMEYWVNFMLEQADAVMNEVRSKFEEVKSEIQKQGLSVDFSDDEEYLSSVEANIEELKNELTSENMEDIKLRFESEVVSMYLELKRRMVYKVYVVMANTFSERVREELVKMKANAEKEGVVVDFSSIELELNELVSELGVLAGKSAVEQSQSFEDDETAKSFENDLQPRFERLFVKAQIKLYVAYGEKIKSRVRENFNEEIRKAREGHNLTIDSKKIDDKLDEIDVMISELRDLQDSASSEELREKVKSLESRVQKIMREVQVVLVEELANNYIRVMRGNIVKVKQEFAEKGIVLNSSIVDGELISIESVVEELKIALRQGDDVKSEGLQVSLQSRFKNFERLAASVLFTQLLTHMYSGSETVIDNYEKTGSDMSAYKVELVVVKGAVDECNSKFGVGDYDWVKENCNPEKVFMKMNQLGKTSSGSSDVI